MEGPGAHPLLHAYSPSQDLSKSRRLWGFRPSEYIWELEAARQCIRTYEQDGADGGSQVVNSSMWEPALESDLAMALHQSSLQD